MGKSRFDLTLNFKDTVKFIVYVFSAVMAQHTIGLMCRQLSFTNLKI